MKKSIQLFAILFTLCLYVHAGGQTPVPKLTDRSNAGIMSYLKTVIKNNQLIIGQQCSETPNTALDYQKNFQRLYDSTGKYPALLGLEYGYFSNTDVTKVNQIAIGHWNKGGLVTIGWHADNPFTDGYNVRWNAVNKRDSIHLTALLKNAPASKERTNYRNELNNTAMALKALKQAGVVVLWRPFHEMNGNWFWWCANDMKQPTNQKDFAALWKDMYETFTVDFGLDNLIWVYSPNAANSGLPAVDKMYPGNDFVDLVAVDIYGKLPEFKDYDALQKLEKIIVNGELGPTRENYGDFNEMEALNTFKGKAAYMLQWHSWTNAKVAIADNLNYKEMMNDPAAITLDKIR